MTQMEHDLIAIGGGAAGLSVGIYGVRSGLKSLVLEKGPAGGLLAEAPWIENFPGLGAIRGADLIEKLKTHTKRYVEVREFEPVDDIRAGEGFLVRTPNGEYNAKAIVFATGTARRKLGVKGEAEFAGKGVTYCPVCDGYLFKGKKVAVVGGGDTAAVDALFLKNLGCDVTMIHRRDQLRAEEVHKKRLEGEVELRLNSVVEEIVGDKFVKGVKIRDTKDNKESMLEVEGVFVCIGEVPNSGLAAKLGVSLDKDGYILTDKAQRTNVPRVYAAGDVTGGVKQVVVSCSEGAVAALSAFEDLRDPYWARK